MFTSAVTRSLLEFAGALVGAGRFERPTPCAQGRCATRLRYAPTLKDSLILNYSVKAALLLLSIS